MGATASAFVPPGGAALAEWRVPSSLLGPATAGQPLSSGSATGGKAGGVYAVQPLKAGRLLERCCCLELAASEAPAGSVFDTFTLETTASETLHVSNEPTGVRTSKHRLLPLGGWCALLRRVSAGNAGVGNVGITLVWEQPPPPSSTASSSSAPADAEVRPWLILRALCDIAVGEELVLRDFPSAPGASLPEEAAAALKPEELRLPRKGCWAGLSSSTWPMRWSFITGADKVAERSDAGISATRVLPGGPSVLRLPEDPRVSICESRLHGAGVFARRDFAAGETVEICPVFPFRFGLADRLAQALAEALAESLAEAFADAAAGPDQAPEATKRVPKQLQDYVFASPFDGEELALLQLGPGCFFNHGRPPNVRVVRFEASPFLWAWVALEPIASGTELLFDYGDHYWRRRTEDPN